VLVKAGVVTENTAIKLIKAQHPALGRKMGRLIHGALA